MATSHIDEFLDPCFAYGFEGGPQFNTNIVELQNGREKRNATWAQQKHRYSGSFLNITKESYMKVKAMHLVAKGRLRAFKLIDPLDNTADNQAFAQGDGVEKDFQLSKTSTIAGISYTRGIYGVVFNDTFEIRVNGVVVPTGYTVDTQRGIVSFDTPPADESVITWSGNFFVWVRFDDDYLPFTLDNPDRTNSTVTMIEVPPPPPETEEV